MVQDIKSQLGSSFSSFSRFLQRPVTLRRKPQPSLRTMRAAQRNASDLKLLAVAINMEADLAWLLDQHEAARHLMRHLSHIERTLQRGGPQALEVLPVKILARALTELERLVIDWSPVGLAELRSRMAVALKQRRAETTADLLAQFDPTQRAIVTEVEHSVFEESQRNWVNVDDEDTSGFAPTQSN
jgi:sulfur carrier protein ThiS